MANHIIGDERLLTRWLLCAVLPMFAGVGPSGSSKRGPPEPIEEEKCADSR
jgi:hypothetical protein